MTGAASLRRYLVDTGATLAYFTFFATISEVFVAGMDAREVAISRLAAIPAMLLAGRPYGVWRDHVMRALAGRLPDLASDTLAFLTFQIPLYAAILFVAGADGAEMAAALSAAVIFMLVLSRPFGLFLDLVRRRAGTAP